MGVVSTVFHTPCAQNPLPRDRVDPWYTDPNPNLSQNQASIQLGLDPWRSEPHPVTTGIEKTEPVGYANAPLNPP